jgi:hypothetical protein
MKAQIANAFHLLRQLPCSRFKLSADMHNSGLQRLWRDFFPITGFIPVGFETLSRFFERSHSFLNYALEFLVSHHAFF